MTRTQKALLGAGSFLPIAFGFVCLFVYFGIFQDLFVRGALQQADPQRVAPELFARMRILYLWMVPAFCIHLTLMILFLLHAVKNRGIGEAERIIWILAFVLVGAIAYPLYFFMRIAGADAPQG